MIPSVATYLTSMLPDAGPAVTGIKGGDTVASQAAQTSRPDKPVAAQAAPVADSVQISDKAMDLNKALNQREDQKGAVQREKERQQQDLAAREKNPYESPAKQYPPFMGNTEALKILKQTSPALYREVLKMIVPPPADLSYADQQMLAASGGGRVKPTDA